MFTLRHHYSNPARYKQGSICAQIASKKTLAIDGALVVEKINKENSLRPVTLREIRRVSAPRVLNTSLRTPSVLTRFSFGRAKMSRGFVTGMESRTRTTLVLG